MPKCTPCIVVVLCKRQPDGDIYNGPEQGVQEGEQTAEGAVVLARSAFYTGDGVWAQAFQVESCRVPAGHSNTRKQTHPQALAPGKGKSLSCLLCGMQTQLPSLCSSAQSKSQEIRS